MGHRYWAGHSMGIVMFNPPYKLTLAAAYIPRKVEQ